MTPTEINEQIKSLGNTELIGAISDGYHTFSELYLHRFMLFIALLKTRGDGWKSREHSDGGGYDKWFIAGCGKGDTAITYHLPDTLWDECHVKPLDKAPEWDGHTSNDVLERLLMLDD